ncbi:MAG: hypothetical protein ABI830_08825 [Pseudolabrys sp.]
MIRKLAIFAALIAAFAFSVQGADAKSRHHHHHHGKKKLLAVQVGMGVASTAAFFAINDWKWNGWDNSSGLTRAGAWGLTTVGCMAVSPMVGTVVLNRELTMREAHVLLGSCVVPIVGGWLVNAAWDAHPEWEPGKKRHHHHMHHKMKMK